MRQFALFSELGSTCLEGPLHESTFVPRVCLNCCHLRSTNILNISIYITQLTVPKTTSFVAACAGLAAVVRVELGAAGPGVRADAGEARRFERRSGAALCGRDAGADGIRPLQARAAGVRTQSGKGTRGMGFVRGRALRVSGRVRMCGRDGMCAGGFARLRACVCAAGRRLRAGGRACVRDEACGTSTKDEEGVAQQTSECQLLANDSRAFRFGRCYVRLYILES
eukprot:6206240-Pleurochrysis_carterae.AAC.1